MRRRQLLMLVGSLVALQRLGNAAQQKGHRIAFLALLHAEDTEGLALLVDQLHVLGYAEGRDISIEYRSAEGHADRLPQLAAELVDLRPDVLVAGFGTVAARAAKATTTTIPVVFTTVGDPVGAGLVSSLAHPGGNVTGLTDQASDIGGKRLEILQEVGGGKTSFGVLMNPGTPYAALATKEILAAAQSRGIHIEVFEVTTADEVRRRMAEIDAAGLGGVVVLGDPLTINAGREIAELALKYRQPTIFQFRESVQAGGLMAYGTDRRQLYRRAADYVDKILRGAKPADLPVEQPTKFELLVNLKTAKALGLAIPPSLLARADDVIE